MFCNHDYMFNFQGRTIFVKILAQCYEDGKQDENGFINFHIFQEYVTNATETQLEFKTVCLCS